MEYHVEKAEGGLCRLTCLFSAAEVSAEWKKAAMPFALSVRMDGFRPGNAPLKVLDRRFGKQINEECANVLALRGIKHALAAEKLIPITSFTAEADTAHLGRDFSFSVSFCVLSQKDAPNLSSLKAEKRLPHASAADDAAALHDILARIAQKVPVKEGRPKDGDIVQAEVTGRIHGHIASGMNTGLCRVRLMPLCPGEKAPDLDPVIRSLSIGETGRAAVLCPSNYPDPSMRGQEMELTVKVLAVERELLPPLNEETAHKLGFLGVDALKIAAHELALERSSAHLRMEAKRSLVERLESWEGANAPHFLVEYFRRKIMSHSRRYLQKSYDSPSKFKEILALMKEEAEQNALKRAVMRELLLAWAHGEGLDVPNEELQKVIARHAAAKNQDAASFARSIALSGEIHEIRAAMLEERAIEKLLSLRP